MVAPRLSVIMPNYNHAHYLPISLRAIFAQSHPPAEVIVIDDASTDRSLEVLGQLGREFPTLRVIRQQSRQGPLVAVNRAARQACGQYLFYASADDQVLPDFFATAIETLQRYPRAGLCCSSVAGFSDEQPQLSYTRLRYKGERAYLDPAEVARAERREFSIVRPRLGLIATFTALMRASAVHEIGQYPPDLGFLSDGFLAHLIAFRHGICLLPDLYFAAYRGNPNSYATAMRRRPREVKAVATRALSLLAGAYADLQPYFYQSCYLREFALHGLAMMVRQPAYRRHLTWPLVAQSLWTELRDRLRPWLPQTVAHGLSRALLHLPPSPAGGASRAE
ncbi:MAG TPA: glycosyltransferase [Candidatus Binataceae bacterium]|nr:glycosyltransferase [Candidatus Binataceae bacterium]